MIQAKRILAVASKEWRLNTRFFTEYLASNLVSPFKTAILMYFLYAGFLGQGGNSLGMVNNDNFKIFVLIGTTCHGVILASIYIFRTRMVVEKWWQTVTATLISPVSTIEVIFGFILGSGTLHFLVGVAIFAAVAVYTNLALAPFLLSILTFSLLALFAFGVSLVGATMALCWEGKSFIFDYTIQLVSFLSCFYYPIDTLPTILHPVVKLLPTFHAAQLIQELFIYGHSANTFYTLSYLSVVSFLMIVLPSLFFERSLKRYGIVGY